MALQRFSASSSNSSGSSSDSSSSSSTVEPLPKKAKPEVDNVRNLSWNQLQSLEVDEQRTSSNIRLGFGHCFSTLFLHYIYIYIFLPLVLPCIFAGLDLVSQRQNSGIAGNDNTYQKNGKSTERVEMALQKTCCKRQCKRALSLKVVMTLVVTFWSLAKGSQDSMPLGISASFPLVLCFWTTPLAAKLGCGACKILQP